MLGTLLLTLLLTALACAVGVLVVVAPFVVGVDMAERRGFSTDRWGIVCLTGVAFALMLGYLVHAHGWSTVLYPPALALAWAGPGLLALLDPSQWRLGGPSGLHER